MKVKMKKCLNCNTLLSNSAKVCTKCGSKTLEKGVYTDEYNQGVIYNKNLKNSNPNVINCPTCGAGITLTFGYGECSFCGDEISSPGNLTHSDYQGWYERNE